MFVFHLIMLGVVIVFQRFLICSLSLAAFLCVQFEHAIGFESLAAGLTLQRLGRPVVSGQMTGQTVRFPEKFATQIALTRFLARVTLQMNFQHVFVRKCLVAVGARMRSLSCVMHNLN